MTPSADPIAAHRALEAAERKIRDAEAARDAAREQLDAALAAHGWSRVVGAFSPGSTPLYRRLGGNSVTLGEVLADLERTAA